MSLSGKLVSSFQVRDVTGDDSLLTSGRKFKWAVRGLREWLRQAIVVWERLEAQEMAEDGKRGYISCPWATEGGRAPGTPT